MAWFFKKDFFIDGCNKKFKVFDGKKRFMVEAGYSERAERTIAKVPIIVTSGAEDLKIDQLDDKSSTVCSIKMIGNSLEISQKLQESRGTTFWPFNRRDQMIDIDISIDDQNSPFISQILIYTPIGKIFGKRVSADF